MMAPPDRDGRVTIFPIAGLPLFKPGDDLARSLVDGVSRSSIGRLMAGDIVVVAQKAVSKVEGRQVRLGDVKPGDEAWSLAAATGKSAELAELILSESQTIMRAKQGVTIVRHRRGHVLANAGIDASNVSPDGEHVLLWPADPDLSARRLRQALEAHYGAPLAVIVSDSLGRAWRLGTTGSCIGVSGLRPLRDRRGESDLFGRTLQATIVATADEIAGAASLVMGEAAEGVPAAVVRGVAYQPAESVAASDLIRPLAEDMFP